jgi:predicted 3-demethylubiquinone-9 3-methyltransferase (glyoxalase superfamily)
VSWQVVPARMEKFFRDVNEARRVMQTLMKMVKSIFGNWRR